MELQLASRFVPRQIGRCITDDDGNNEDSKQKRPPWKTHCIASWGLRLVKNNTTGEARLQLYTES